MAALARIQVKSTVIVDSPIEDVWKVSRKWGHQPWMPLLPDGTTFDVSVLGGRPDSEVGVLRCSRFGGGKQIFERLVAVDEQEYRMRWQAVAHEDTISPFEEASFINFNTNLRLSRVTIGNLTFAEWSGEFFTEPEFASSMRQTFEAWYMFGMLSLKDTFRATSLILQTALTSMSKVELREYMARYKARKAAQNLLPSAGTQSVFSYDGM